MANLELCQGLVRSILGRCKAESENDHCSWSQGTKRSNEYHLRKGVHARGRCITVHGSGQLVGTLKPRQRKFKHLQIPNGLAG